MHLGIKELLERQRRERVTFCGFNSDPTDVGSAIVELVGRFANIGAGQVIYLLDPWFLQHVTACKIEDLVFSKKIKSDYRWTSLSLPRV